MIIIISIKKKGEYNMSTLELLQLQNEHKDNFFGKGEENCSMSESIMFAEVSEEELKDLEKRANNSPVSYADSRLFKYENCKVVDLLDGTILMVPDKKGE